MDLTIGIQSIKHLFSFPFHDPNWKNKILIGAALFFAGYFVPLIPWLPALGYLARVVRSGANNEDAGRLPEWDNWNDLFIDGGRLFISGLIFGLPAGVIMFFGWTIYMLSIFSIGPNSGTPSGTSVMLMFIAMGIFFLSMGLSILFSLVALMLMPAAQAHILVNRRFAAVFEVGAWWRSLRTNFGGYLLATGIFLALYMLMIVGFQLLYLTIVLCLFAPLLLSPVLFYAGLVYYRLIGQAYGETLGGGAAAQVSEPTLAPMAL